MTQEQYKRVVEIFQRIKDLEEVKKEIKGTSEHRLTYSYRDYNGGYKFCNSYTMRDIGNILDRHDKMIREEIDAEIDKLKKEIEEL